MAVSAEPFDGDFLSDDDESAFTDRLRAECTALARLGVQENIAALDKFCQMTQLEECCEPVRGHDADMKQDAARISAEHALRDELFGVQRELASALASIDSTMRSIQALNAAIDINVTNQRTRVVATMSGADINEMKRSLARMQTEKANAEGQVSRLLSAARRLDDDRLRIESEIDML